MFQRFLVSFVWKMLGKVVFLLVPVVLCVARCGGGGCRAPGARIASGDIPERNSRPFQVALYTRVGEEGELGFCGGSLIHPEWVLTAAHCCFHGEQPVDNVQAILGAHSLYDRFENGRRIVAVADVVPHPAFERDTFANDVALLRLGNTLQLTDTIDVIRLPYLSMSQWNFAGMVATASGWGIVTPGVTFVSPTLRQKTMTVLTDPLCNSNYLGQLPDNMVCGFNTTAGTCKGDNGGPMTIFHNATEEVILIGVVSFIESSGCSEDFPSIFTRTQRYLDWISDVTGMLLD